MDTFFEQIVSIRKSGKALAGIIGIWLLAFIISAALLLFPILGSFNLIIICGVLFGAFKLSTFFNIEYEYIITNGTLDVDKIINRSSRKRILSLELPQTSRLEKFNPHMLQNLNAKQVIIACNNTDEAYLLVSEKEGKGASYLVFAPDERLRSAIVKFVPKFIANSAFK